MTDTTGTIAELDHAHVSRAVVGGREQIPTMASLLEEFPQVRFNIDLKSEAAVEPLARLVRATGARDRVCVGAFSRGRISRFRRHVGGRVATAASPADVALTRFAAPGTRRRAGRCPAALQVPARRGPVRVVTAGFVARAHAAGQHVHVWTVDEPAAMHRLLELGVDGLMTDRTDLLREVLVQRGQWVDG